MNLSDEEQKQNVISDKEFEEMYGRPPVRARKRRVKVYWDRVIIALLVLVLIIFGIVQLIKSIAGHFKSDDTAEPAAAETVESTASSEESDETQESQLQFKVCIDAGHGGEDGGTTTSDESRIEKDDDLRIALAVQEYLEEQGAVVLMIRDDDTFVELEKRPEIANENNCDLYVSLHRNSYDGDMGGVEIWVHQAEPTEDIRLAQNILDNLEEVGISNNRGIQYGYLDLEGYDYAVNSSTTMPSCLVELGFITDDTDNQLFDANLEAYAMAIGDGIIQTAKDLDVIDDDGNRLLESQLISQAKKDFYASSSESTSDTDESASDSEDTSTDEAAE